MKRRYREAIKRFIAKVSRRYYWEDYTRVYPDDLVFQRSGKARAATPNEHNNFLNHLKGYRFAGQFVKGKVVADIACGSGYGCEAMKAAGASEVHGADVSRHAIRFARSRFGDLCEFSLQEMTNLKKFRDDYFDVSISSEALEHVKDFGREADAVKEMKRITKRKGLILIVTPNDEVTGGHGFSFDALTALLNNYFSRYLLFENALLPFGERKAEWERRLAEGRVGVIINENIDLAETMVISKEKHEIKQGIPPGTLMFEDLEIDTRRLHNTHSWIVLAINAK